VLRPALFYHSPCGLWSKLQSFYAVTPDPSDQFCSILIPGVLGSFISQNLKDNQKLSLTFESVETVAEQTRLKCQTILAFSNFLGVLKPRLLLRRSDSPLCTQSDDKMICE
jgi:hypothetical protein